jgi:O-antigen ligase
MALPSWAGREPAPHALLALLVLLIGAAAVVPRFGPLALVVPAGIAAAAVTVVRPSLGLAFFAFILYSRASEVVPNQLGLPTFAPVFAVLLLTALVARYGSGVLRRLHPEEWQPLAAYSLTLLASALVATNPEQSLAALADQAKNLAAVFIIVIATRGIRDLRLLMWSLIAAGVLPTLITIWQAFTGSTNQFYGFGQFESAVVTPGELTWIPRPAGPVGDPNFYALMLVPLIPLAFHHMRHSASAAARCLALAAALVLAVAVVLTYSRGGYIALVAVLVASALLRLVRWRSILIAGVVGLLAVVILSPSHAGRIAGMADVVPVALGQAQSPDDPSVSNRINEMATGVRMFIDHPALGVGIRNFPEHFQDYARPRGIETPDPRSPHSLFIQIAAETGIIGLAAFLIVLASLFFWLRRAWRRPDQPAELRDAARAMAAALAGYLVGSLFLHAAYPRFFYVLVAATLATHAVARGYARIAEPEATYSGRQASVSPLGMRPAYAGFLVLGALAVALLVWNAMPLAVASRGTREPGVLAPSAATTSRPLEATGTNAVVASVPAAAATSPATATTGVVPPAAGSIPDTPARRAAAPAGERAGCRYFAGTGHNVCGDFQEYWEAYGGLVVFGFPLSEAFEHDGSLVQYFERARFEWHPEHAGTRFEVLLTRLGSQVDAVRGSAASAVEPSADTSCRYFDVTRHNLCGAFKDYWEAYGALHVLGYPLTEALEEDGTTVQYFERARLEWRPGTRPERFDILAAPLGERALQAAIAQAPPAEPADDED